MTDTTQTERFPTFYVSHGGGPWIFMHDKTRERYANGRIEHILDKVHLRFTSATHRHALLKKSLNDIPRQIGYRKPKAVLMVSAHWEEPDFTVMGSAKPPMVWVGEILMNQSVVI